MATFAQASFNASTYGAFRPTYPPRLIKTIIGYHTQNGRRTSGASQALDLGCGTGEQSALMNIAPSSTDTIGLHGQDRLQPCFPDTSTL